MLSDTFEANVVETCSGFADVVVQLDSELAVAGRYPAIAALELCAHPVRFAGSSHPHVARLRSQIARIKQASQAQRDARAFRIERMDEADESEQELLRAPEALQAAVTNATEEHALLEALTAICDRAVGSTTT